MTRKAIRRRKTTFPAAFPPWTGRFAKKIPAERPKTPSRTWRNTDGRNARVNDPIESEEELRHWLVTEDRELLRSLVQTDTTKPNRARVKDAAATLIAQRNTTVARPA